jgi:heme ABC exporter ATP-binding subunit CcmA
VPVLAGVDLEVAAGEVVVLLGSNGAGKTTLLRVLATLLRPSGGTLRLFGEDATRRAPAARRRLGYVGHDSACYPDLTGRENLEFHAELHDVPDAAARVADLLRWAGLEDAARRPARTYSRGMTQRLALARVLLHAPELLLLDEPYSGLDPAAATRLDGLLRELPRAGHAIVLSTHDVERVTPFATRVGGARGAGHAPARDAGLAGGAILRGRARGARRAHPRPHGREPRGRVEGEARDAVECPLRDVEDLRGVGLRADRQVVRVHAEEPAARIVGKRSRRDTARRVRFSPVVDLVHLDPVVLRDIEELAAWKDRRDEPAGRVPEGLDALPGVGDEPASRADAVAGHLAGGRGRRIENGGRLRRRCDEREQQQGGERRTEHTGRGL